jgi:CDP-diacylglycerol--serine O-phosphatidyltransferase
MAVLMVTLGLLMVSTFRFWSLKSIDFRQRRTYRSALAILSVVVLLAFWPELFLPGFAIAYAASGPLAWAIGRIRSRPS